MSIEFIGVHHSEMDANEPFGSRWSTTPSFGVFLVLLRESLWFEAKTYSGMIRMGTDARPGEAKGPMEDGILSTAMAIDLPPIEPLCLSYGQNDEWSLPIETVASAFSCHE